MSAGAFQAVLIVLLLAPVAVAAQDPDHLVLGGEDEADGTVFYPRQVEEGPDGDLYVLDVGDSFIKVFAPDGAFRRRLGGSGEGPGEFQRVDGATFGFTPDGKLFFTEYIRGHRWITILELNGDLARVLSPNLAVGFGIEAARALDDGGFLVQITYNATPIAEGDYFLYHVPRSLVRLDGQGEIVAEIARTKCARLISYSPNGGTTNLPFAPSFAWSAVGDDAVVWSDGTSPRLRVIDHAGSLVREMETRLPDPRKVTREDLREWKREREEMMSSRNPAWWHEFGRVVEEYDKSLYDQPILRRISRTPGGNLLVEGPWQADTDASTFWLLDSDGEVIHSITAAAARLRLSEHYLLFLTVDDEGAVLANAVKRPIDEAEALARLEMIAAGRSE